MGSVACEPLPNRRGVDRQDAFIHTTDEGTKHLVVMAVERAFPRASGQFPRQTGIRK
jgi:hypothetical protein